jgi:hypothetical protein
VSVVFVILMAFLIVLKIFVGEFLLYEKFREEILDTALFRRNIIEILFRKKFKKYVYFVG